MSRAEELLTCPLDKSHKILKSRIQVHLVRCKKNHNMENWKTCLFNATHIVPKKDYDAHMTTCPDYRELQNAIFSTDDREIPGLISMEQVKKAEQGIADFGENWDDEPCVGTYDPYEATAGREIIRPLIVAPKSEKKRWRRQERQKMAQFKNESACNSKEVRVEKSLESVKEKLKADAVDDQLLVTLKNLNISEKESREPQKQPAFRNQNRK